MITIYKIINLYNYKIYIGKTKQDVSLRINKHNSTLKTNKHYNSHLQRAYNKNGSDNFIYSILEYTDESNWKEREIYWINIFNANNKCFGYNLTLGGEGGNGRVPSKKEINRLIERNKKMIWTKEMREKSSKRMSEIQKEYWTEENRKLARERSKKYGKRGGWKLSNEFKDKRRELMVNFKHSQKTKDNLKRLRLHSSKQVKCIENGIIYPSLKEAARQINTNASNIRSHLQGKLKRIKKLTFAWN